jgi:hypothetical protein
MTARPALDAWLAESAQVLERVMPFDQCVDGDGVSPSPSASVAPPRPPRVQAALPGREADATTAPHGVVATSRQLIGWLWKKGLSI